MPIPTRARTSSALGGYVTGHGSFRSSEVIAPRPSLLVFARPPALCGSGSASLTGFSRSLTGFSRATRLQPGLQPGHPLLGSPIR
jgi:hypothetical protein